MVKPFALLHVSALVVLVLHILPRSKTSVWTPESHCPVRSVVLVM